VQNKSEHLSIIEQQKQKNYDPFLLFISDEDDDVDDDRSSLFFLLLPIDDAYSIHWQQLSMFHEIHQVD